MDNNIPFLGKNTDIELFCITVIVSKRYENPLSLFLYRQINSMIFIAVRLMRDRKSVVGIRMHLFQMPAHLSAQILVQTIFVHTHPDFIERLLPLFRQFHFLLQKYALKTVALLHNKPQIVPVVRRQVLIFPNAFFYPAFRLRPLVLDISQGIKDSQIEVYGRQSKARPQTACCHLVLHGIARLNLWQAFDSAITLIHIVLYCPVIPRDLLQFFHIRLRDRSAIILADSLTYSIWRHFAVFYSPLLVG